MIIATAAATAAATATITGFAIYDSRGPLEVAFPYNGTTSGKFGLPKFIPV
ncbi:hypothetical protein [Candidatus Nitrososphaera gargensis]|uniref:hypothetical protein n=1 Tax=Candidatus Nitrososphaera gargensis TaxID=497727 RepID=UPI001E5CDBDD|nr:hypothetical protein [Candidatus Nitrososphaera gargensis]